MSDANRTAIRVSRESAYRVPQANPLFQPIRIVSVGLTYSPETVTSNELDETRQIADQPLVGFSSGGDVPTELSIGNMDACMEGLFMNPWIRSPEVLNGASWKYGFGSAAANRITSLTNTTLTLAATSVLSGSASNQPATAFKAGHLLYFSGFGIADQILKATGSAATTVTVAGAVAVGAPPASARVKVVGFEGAAGDITATVTGGTAIESTALNFTTLGLTLGQWVYLNSPSSYGFAAFSGFCRISAIAATRLSFDIVPNGFVADAAGAKTIRVFFTDTIRNGVVEGISYHIEEEFGLKAGIRYMYHRGQEVNSRVISAETKAIITDTWNFMGSDATPVDPARLANVTTLAKGSGSVLNSSTAVPLFLEDATVVTAPNYVNSFSISMENGKRARDAVGFLGSASIGTGRINVSGNLSTYFGSEVLYNKVITNEITSIAFGLADVAKRAAEIYDVPKVKFSGGNPDVTGIDTDIMVPITWQGLVDRENGRDYTILLSRFEYYI